MTAIKALIDSPSTPYAQIRTLLAESDTASVPSDADVADLAIHQLKYPTVGAKRDINVIFPIERLRELVADTTIGSLTKNFYTLIGYNMHPKRFEDTFAEELADAVAAVVSMDANDPRRGPHEDRGALQSRSEAERVAAWGVYRPT